MAGSTPIFYHSAQKVSYSFISVSKIPIFIEQSGGEIRGDFSPYQFNDFCVAHSPGYVEGVLSNRKPNGFGTMDEELTNSLRYTSAGHWAAVKHVLKEGGVACSATQGFHHAGYRTGGGFCTFNGLMITAIKAIQEGVQNVLIIDGDGHYGNGTEDIIKQMGLESRVAHITRPEIGRPIQYHWNTRMWQSFARDLIRSSKPGIILYQAGADAWDQDPFNAGYLSKEGLASRDRGIFTAAREAEVPLVWNLAGGYANVMQDTIDIHLQTLRISNEVYHATTREHVVS